MLKRVLVASCFISLLAPTGCDKCRVTQSGTVCDSNNQVVGEADGGGTPDAGSTSTPSSDGAGGDGGTGMPGVAYIRVAQNEHDVLGAAGSGWNEQTTITFQVIAADGTPYPAGLPVVFTHASQGGSFIGTVPNCTTGATPTCTAQGVTDANGSAQVLLTSGRTFAILTVRADATVGGVDVSIVAGGIAVVGAKPNGAHISLDCRPYNVPALTMEDCLYSRYAGQERTVDCTLSLADRNGVVIGIPTFAAFQSEAGGVTPGAYTPAYDPTKDATAQVTLGQAVGFLDVYGYSLPVDVDPQPGEISVASFPTACGTQTVNPRDGMVTVIAFVHGEEGFADVNGNGVYDGPNSPALAGTAWASTGEPFIDIGEPYVDANDNGVYDGPRSPALAGTPYYSTGEPYVDVNGNGKYDGPNGKWDSDTVLWTQTRVLYTGYPAYAIDGSSNELFSRYYSSGTPPAPTPAPPLPPAPAFTDSTQFGVFFADQNLNPLTAETTYTVTTATGNAKATLIGPWSTADSMGAFFRLRYCNKPTSPTACYDGPAEVACRTAPCYVVPDVSNFLYGNPGTVTITCVKTGPDTVIVSATIEGVTMSMPLSGTCP